MMLPSNGLTMQSTAVYAQQQQPTSQQFFAVNHQLPVASYIQNQQQMEGSSSGSRGTLAQPLSTPYYMPQQQQFFPLNQQPAASPQGLMQQTVSPHNMWPPSGALQPAALHTQQQQQQQQQQLAYFHNQQQLLQQQQQQHYTPLSAGTVGGPQLQQQSLPFALMHGPASTVPSAQFRFQAPHSGANSTTPVNNNLHVAYSAPAAQFSSTTLEGQQVIAPGYDFAGGSGRAPPMLFIPSTTPQPTAQPHYQVLLGPSLTQSASISPPMVLQGGNTMVSCTTPPGGYAPTLTRQSFGMVSPQTPPLVPSFAAPALVGGSPVAAPSASLPATPPQQQPSHNNGVGLVVGEAMAGTVKRYNPSRGFGFIRTDTGVDIFVHQSCIKMEGFRAVNVGARVRFTVGLLMDTVQAIDVVQESPYTPTHAQQQQQQSSLVSFTPSTQESTARVTGSIGSVFVVPPSALKQQHDLATAPLAVWTPSPVPSAVGLCALSTAGENLLVPSSGVGDDEEFSLSASKRSAFLASLLQDGASDDAAVEAAWGAVEPAGHAQGPAGAPVERLKMPVDSTCGGELTSFGLLHVTPSSPSVHGTDSPLSLPAADNSSRRGSIEQCGSPNLVREVDPSALLPHLIKHAGSTVSLNTTTAGMSILDCSESTSPFNAFASETRQQK